jgi:hypothetical protein
MTIESDELAEIKNSLLALTGWVQTLTIEFTALIQFLDHNGLPSDEYRKHVDQAALAKYTKMISDAVDKLGSQSHLRDLKPPTDVVQ